MIDSAAMSAVPVATVEILNDLLDAELNSVFRFMGEGSPYLSRATADVRRPLAEMVASTDRRAGEIYSLIESLGGTPIPRGLRSDEQYLAFLSLKFLLPKLVTERELTIRRYENAIAGLKKAPERAGEATQLLQGQLGELRQELEVLRRAADDVVKAAKA
jgi:hypothetical protein